MRSAVEKEQPGSRPAQNRAVARRMIQVLLQFALIGVLLFVSAGRLDWGWAWAYLGVSAGVLVCNVLILPPELIAERGRRGEGVKRWDKVLTSISILPALAAPIVAGLDDRLGWSPPVVSAVHLAGLGAFGLGQACFSWAMASNPFFSAGTRIQSERGHQVVTRGPYRFVRHPGYAAFMIFAVAAPLALGSVWALIPAGVTDCLFVIRTALEDRTLRIELAGYEAYAGEVRYRLIPGLW
jgi:protein-S-isoprenylcysteine O-methyltransferase Ste14